MKTNTTATITPPMDERGEGATPGVGEDQEIEAEEMGTHRQEEATRKYKLLLKRTNI